MSKRERRRYSTELKHQIVAMYQSGKRRCEILRDHNIGNSGLDRWIDQAEN